MEDAGDSWIFSCPHEDCRGLVIVMKSEVNCAIFRHLASKADLIQVNPHLPRAECERLVATGDYIGCGRPFQVNVADRKTIICDYI